MAGIEPDSSSLENVLKPLPRIETMLFFSDISYTKFISLLLAKHNHLRQMKDFWIFV